MRERGTKQREMDRKKNRGRKEARRSKVAVTCISQKPAISISQGRFRYVSSRLQGLEAGEFSILWRCSGLH